MEITAVLCVRNSAPTIASVIESLLSNGVDSDRIVVVDGLSDDSSAEIAESLGCFVVSDDGKGFTYARALGASLSKTDFTLVIGPDDVLDTGVLPPILDYLDQNENCAGVQLSKRCRPISANFFDRGMDAYYSNLPVGKVPVIGTPSVFRTKLLNSSPYDAKLTNDDTDWCFRVSDLGYFFYRSGELFSTEISSLSWKEYKARWIWYGRGDYDFIEKHLRMDSRRAFRHFLHPAREYIGRLAVRELMRANIRGSLFMIVCGLLRYWGMLERLNQKVRGKFK